MRSNKLHELKTWPEYYQAVIGGIKNFEIRENDRNFKVGDTLLLREWNRNTGGYTGNSTLRTITYLVTDAHHFGLRDGFCIMSIANIEEQIDTEEAA